MNAMEDRPYQTKAKADVVALYEKGAHEVVLAACPSAGKTKMAIDLILWARRQSSGKVLVLTHGTNVLKTQWGEKLAEAGVAASTDFSTDVTYTIPQAVQKLSPTGDFLIIDEAHEFTFAKRGSDEDYEGMVARIKKGFRRVLYLTGTPSKFIARREYDGKLIIIPAVDLIPEYVSDLYIGLASTNAPIDEDSYNSAGDLREDGDGSKKLARSVRNDLDSLLDAIVARLRGVLKTKPLAKQVIGWPAALGRLHKTMLACQSVEQARKVERALLRKGVKVVSSNYENDPDSEQIEVFRRDHTVTALIVVDRGILGFDMTDLVNVIDMTCSRNIDRIYQLYARAMRKCPQHPDKFFFKLVPEGQMEFGKFYMQAALMMMDREFISTYNGRNLNGCKVPAFRPRNEQSNEPRQESWDRGKKAHEKVHAIDAFFYDTVMAKELLVNVLNKCGREFNEYAKVTIREVKQGLGVGVAHERLTVESMHALAAKMTAEWLAAGGK